LPKIENICKKITKKFAGTKPLPEPKTKTNPDCLRLTVFLKPFFAKRSKTKNDACQADKRKACHNVYSFHYLTSFLHSCFCGFFSIKPKYTKPTMAMSKMKERTMIVSMLLKIKLLNFFFSLGSLVQEYAKKNNTRYYPKADHIIQPTRNLIGERSCQNQRRRHIFGNIQ